ncbi:MAG: hypothetical protein K8M05_24855 [Deltaproteobacteria bacterium]|nr:hypothetical protein [Kofleriaceae bacterium]
MSEPPESELRALATACLDETRAFLAAHPGAALEHDDIYRLGLANQMALNLLHEASRRRKPSTTRVFVSTAANLAQESSLLATARRRHDPTLRAEAETVPAEAPPR